MFVLLAALNCAAEVHIREVGLQGYVGRSGPQRLRVEMSNPSPRPETYVLRVTESYLRAQNYHADHQIGLNAGETRTFDVPVLIGSRNNLKVEQVNAGGLTVSSDEKDISPETSGLIAVVCAATAVCKAVANAVRSGRSVEEQNAKERELKIVSVTKPPQSWFAYEQVRTIVVAGQIEDASARDAIEDFARFGGEVIVAADLAPRDFLAAYRIGDTRKMPIGNGTLRFVNTSTGQQMKEMFQPERVAGDRGLIPWFRVSTISGGSLLNGPGPDLFSPVKLADFLDGVLHGHGRNHQLLRVAPHGQGRNGLVDRSHHRHPVCGPVLLHQHARKNEAFCAGRGHGLLHGR